MRIVSNTEMQEIDRWAQENLGISGAVLMENAGRGCVEILKGYFELKKLKVLVVCGRGNNGGDGMVIARHLKNNGSDVEVILLGKEEDLKGDARLNYQILKRTGIEIREIDSVKGIKNVFKKKNFDCIIDAIFGTGFKGRPEGIYYEAIELINNSDSFVFSVDIPSGVNGDTGDCAGNCVVADATASMCLPKLGNYLYPGRMFCGKLHLIDIGIPYHLIDQGFPRIVEFDDVYSILPWRDPAGNKGTFGEVLIIAGARGFSGAGAMAAISCLRTGAGLVRLAAPEGIMDSLEAKLLEVVKVPLKQTAQETISPAAIDTILPLLERSDVLIIGPGITTHNETEEFVLALLPRVKIPLIIDADALNILSKNIKTFEKIKTDFILTPHPGELSRLTGISVGNINQKRIDIASRFAREFGGIMVLKGAPTIIADPDQKVFLNPTGNSGLATAGSGDVLVGMIGGLLAQGVSSINSAVGGVFLHGLASDLYVQKKNEYSLIASDLIDYIPESINFILNREYEKEKSVK
uniref:Bifunctional NAD(P)H-hydrate repair enzyme n=1 Tax=candidate division WOR-3 bacterium TaxID=2052148 RepID=A0A7C4XL29_UNCW3